MTVRVRKVETGAVVGVSEDIAEMLCVSGEFERVVDVAPVPAKKAASKKSSSKK